MQRRRQRNLVIFGQLAALDAAVKDTLRRVCAESGLSREQIVDDANELAAAASIRLTGGNARELTLATLDKWLAPTATDYLPPMRALVVLCIVSSSVEPLSVLSQVCGGRVINEDQAEILRLAEIAQEIEELQRERRRIKKCLKQNG